MLQGDLLGQDMGWSQTATGAGTGPPAPTHSPPSPGLPPITPPQDCPVNPPPSPHQPSFLPPGLSPSRCPPPQVNPLLKAGQQCMPGSLVALGVSLGRGPQCPSPGGMEGGFRHSRGKTSS